MARFSFALGVLVLLTVAWALPAPSKNSPFDSSSEESDEEIMQEIRELCRNNSGSDAAYGKLTKSMEQTMMCAMNAVDFDSLARDADTLSNETRFTFFPQYCPQLRTAGNCLNGLLKAAQPCLEDDDYTIVKALAGILPDAVELICKNDGEILFKLDEPNYQQCVEKLSDNVMECVVPFMTEADNWDISHLTHDQCGTLFGFRRCVQGKLDVCKAPDLISVYDLFHNTLFRMTPCRNYVATPQVTQIDNNAISEA